MNKGKARLTHRSLPYHGFSLLAKLYSKIYRKQQIHKGLFKRAVANGLDKNEVQIASQQIKSKQDMPRLWLSVANERLNKALYWMDLGIKSQARDYYLQSSLWAFYAYLLVQDRQEKQEIFSQFRNSYQLAAPHFAFPAQAVEIPYLGTALSGYLRLPTLPTGGNEPIKQSFPCIILFNGLGSSKEELHFTENSLLSSGLATLSFDYPALNDHKSDTSFCLDINQLANSLYLFLSNKKEIDADRLGLYGISIGGNIALSIASQYPKIYKAIATLSAPYDLSSNLDMLLPILFEQFALLNTTSQTYLFDLAHQTALPAFISNINAPLLVASGSKDSISSEQDSRSIYDASSSFDKKLLLCPKASHGLYEMMPSLRYEIALWMKERLCR